MKLLIDMNLSPSWVQAFAAEGWEAIHWSEVGLPTAEDDVIMDYARSYAFVVFTNDLDFGTMLALTQAGGPSVVQVRTQNLRTDYLGPLLLPILRTYENQLMDGALLVVEEGQSRLRLLPLRS
jgi:predicted nuclease of predicted toxin-antitoxin system